MFDLINREYLTTSRPMGGRKLPSLIVPRVEIPIYADSALTFAALHRKQAVPEMPPIRQFPMYELNALLCSGPVAPNSYISAAYLHTLRECWIGEQSSSVMAGCLAHEFTHYLQDLEIDFDKHRAMMTPNMVIEHEIEAHLVQWDFLTKRGTLETDPLYRAVKHRDEIPDYVARQYGPRLLRSDARD